MYDHSRADFEPGKLPFLTGEEASGGLNEYGAVVAGSWEREVAAALGD